MKETKKTIVFLMLIALIISSLLLFTADPFYGHDIGFHLSRIQSIADCFAQGTFPALIYPHYFNDYGYANGIFYPDLFLYIPALFVYLGLDCKIAYNVFLFLINLATLSSMYYCIKKIANDPMAASLTSCIYLLSSYRITDLYVRSALGETICFVFIPFILLGLYEILYADTKKGWYLIIGLFGVLSSHIITLAFCVILIILFYILSFFRLFKNKKELKERTVSIFVYCFLSVCLCAFFILPFLEMMFSDTFMYKINPATGGYDRTIPFLLSIIEIPTYRNIYFPLGIGMIFVVLSILLIKDPKDYKRAVYDYIAFGILFWVMSTDLFPWQLFKGFAQTIQFPWRFMAIATSFLLFGFSFVIKRYINKDNVKKPILLLLIITSCISLLSIAYDMFIIEDFELYTDAVHYSTGGNEYLPADVDLNKIVERGLTLSSNDPGIHLYFEKTGTNMIITYENASAEKTYIEAPLIYYKGYTAKEDGKTISVSKGDNGVVRLYPSDKEGIINLRYGSTLIRKLGYLISFLTLSVLLFIGIKQIKRSR